jgi:hypothetical protein
VSGALEGNSWRFLVMQHNPKRKWMGSESPSWNAKSDNRRWRSTF